MFLIAPELSRKCVPDKFHFGVGHGFFPGYFVAVHLAFLMHDTDDDLAGKLG